MINAFDALMLGFEPQEPEPQGAWRVRGDGNTDYYVTWHADGSWTCTCPYFVKARKDECKHIQDITTKLRGAPQEPEPTTPDDAPPTRAPVPAAFRAKRNTAVPADGIVLGGKAPPTKDPWAAPTPMQGRSVEVGGTVTMGGDPPEKGDG